MKGKDKVSCLLLYITDEIKEDVLEILMRDADDEE